MSEWLMSDFIPLTGIALGAIGYRSFRNDNYWLAALCIAVFVAVLVWILKGDGDE